MPVSRVTRAAARLRRGALAVAPSLGACVLLLGSTGSSGNAIANGETRTLEIYHTHTHESATITYRRNGQFDRDGLEKLNWILRDWRRDEPTSMDPRLFDIVWEVHREVGSNEPLNIVSGYRAPETNAMLRRRSRSVAKHSQHMLGKAMDFYLPDVSMAKVREVGLRLQRGGVGYYPTAYNPFVHLDAGSVRHWPRMTRDQLARIFPDGKTVHIPADGRPMPGYDLAAAEIERSGGSVSAYAEAGDEDTGFFSGKGKSFFAALFGLGNDAAQEQKQARAQVTRRAARLARAEPPPEEPARPAVEPFETVVSATPAEEATPPRPAVVAALPKPQVEDAGEPAPAASAPARPPAPQLVWQQGPAGDSSGIARPGVPLPLSRPVELAAVTFANVPLPPVRPVEVASLSLKTVTSDAIGVAEAISAPGTPLPSTSTLSAAVPLPPPRPWAEPALARTASAGPRPPSTTGSTQPSRESGADRSALDALFTSVSLAGPRNVGGPAHIRTARTHAAPRDVAGLTGAPASSVVMNFGSGQNLTSDRFSGPAVQALTVAKFVP